MEENQETFNQGDYVIYDNKLYYVGHAYSGSWINRTPSVGLRPVKDDGSLGNENKNVSLPNSYLVKVSAEEASNYLSNPSGYQNAVSNESGSNAQSEDSTSDTSTSSPDTSTSNSATSWNW